MDFVFDTGSPWVWLPNKDCPNDSCTNQQYNYDLSSDYYDYEVVERINYAQGYALGTLSNDNFALTPSPDT